MRRFISPVPSPPCVLCFDTELTIDEVINMRLIAYYFELQPPTAVQHQAGSPLIFSCVCVLTFVPFLPKIAVTGSLFPQVWTKKSDSTPGQDEPMPGRLTPCKI